jgi:NAD(P) transhydrogenase subunit alpha
VISANGVKVIGPVNLPGTLAYNASEMYARNLFNFLQARHRQVRRAEDRLDRRGFRRAVLTHDGAIKHEATRKAVEG